MSNVNNRKVVRYNKWGYFFLIPFIVVYIIFQLIPLCSTIYYSFYEYYRVGIIEVGPNWVGTQNYSTHVFNNPDIWKYLGNTAAMWIIGFIPQILVSLLLGAWFSDNRLKLKAEGFYKVVIYLPNVIMASAFAMLFFTLFGSTGPVHDILANMGIIDQSYDFFHKTGSTRALVGLMNFLMWFGNTTILLMAGMLGIDPSLFEASEVDGANSTQKFFKVTLPLLRPILLFVVITSLIGGIQMFDVPQILTSGDGFPKRTTMSIIMYLNKHLYSKNYGAAGSLSVFLFVITAILSVIVFAVSGNKDKLKGK